MIEAGRRAAAIAALGFLVCSIVPSKVFAATGTPAGTPIVNSASAAYSDGSGNAFTSVSNTVSTTVQSAPSLSIVAGATQKTVPGGQLSSSFVATNTGNGVATLAFTVPSQTGTDGSATSIVAYALDTVGTTLPTLPAGCTSTSTTAASCQTLAELNTLAASLPLAAGKTLVVYIVYNVPNGAAAGTLAAPQTVITTLGGTASQSVANNAGTSGTVTSAPLATPPSETDDVLADARLDLQKAGVNSGSASLSYTIYGADGGATAAHDLLSVKTLLGGASGVFVSDAIPQFGGAPLAVQSIALATSTANGFAASTVTYYYSTSPTPTGWTALAASATPPTTATFVGVLFSGGANGIELNPNNGATSTGRVSAANAAFTLTIVTAAPAGPNSGNTNAVVNQVDSVVGGGEANPTPDSAVTNPAPYVLGPAIPANTSDAANAGLVTAAGTGLAYPTQAAGSAATQQGASNAVGNAANASGSVFNGPSANPTATGSYNAVAPVNASNDFSAIAYSPSGFVPTNTSPTGVTGNTLGSTVTSSTYVTFVNTLQNQGNAADNITVGAVAPSGWTVAIYAAGAMITPGNSLSGPAAATASATFAGVPSGSASSTTNLLSYQVVYYPSSAATAFTTYDSVVTATSANSPSVSNTTHDEIVIGGPLALSKTQTLDPTTCTGGAAVPGCIIKYAIAYTNNALPASACPATAPTTYPAYDGGYFVKGLTISENGKTGVNTWGATYTTSTGATANVTTGLNAPAADTTTGTTFTGNTAGSYAFAASIGATGLILAPGCSGTITFAVTVSTS